MRKLASYVGQFRSEVKAFVAERLTLVHLRAATGHMVDLIFPRPSDEMSVSGLSPETWARIRFLDHEGCDMCARPFEGGLHLGADARCTWCTDKPFPFLRTRAACIYDDASKDIILAFKHGDRLDLAPILTRWLSRAGARMVSEADMVIPVPLHRWRLLKRRYNQAAELARPLARLTGRHYEPDALQRIQMTRQQGRTVAERWANVRNAFTVTADGRRRISGKTVVLVDDVFTTGSTLRACATELLKAGAARVDVLVLARAARSDPL